MADFEVEQSEGMRRVRIDLENDDCRTERRALAHMQGSIVMDVPLPSLHTLWVSLFSEETILRPRYVGTGSIALASSLGGYHVMRVVPGEQWVLDTRCFWASDGEVRLRIFREGIFTALWAGQGLLWYKTSLSGDGQAVLAVDGPIKEVTLDGGRLVVDGPFVVARTAGIRLRVRRPAKSLLSYWLSGQKRAFVYEGTGKLLLCPVPYWRLRMKRERADAALEG